jgi:hypothetical protein
MTVTRRRDLPSMRVAHRHPSCSQVVPDSAVVEPDLFANLYE